MTAPLTALGPAASVETILAAVDAGNAQFWEDRREQTMETWCERRTWNRMIEATYPTEGFVPWNTRAALAHRDAVAGLRWFKSDARALCLGDGRP